MNQERSERNVEQILYIIEQVAPLETDLLGKKTALAIARGESFESFSGGRHLNLLEAITMLSGLATVIQVAIQILEAWKESKKPSTDELKQAVLDEIRRSHPRLIDLVTEKQETFKEIHSLLDKPLKRSQIT